MAIIVPTYNESGNVVELVRRIGETLAGVAWEVIVVDDGSSDHTEQEVRAVDGVQYLRNDENRGKGYSVRRGMMAARCDHVLFTDADLSAPIAEARRLLTTIEKGADVAIASRRFDVTTTVDRTRTSRSAL